MTLAVKVYDGTDPWDLPGSYLGTFAEDTARKISDVKNEPGSWSVTVPRDSADAALLAPNNVVRFEVDGTIRFAGRIAPWDQQTIDAGEEASEDITVSGPGLLDTLRDAVVYPHPDCTLKHETRYFNFASLDYVDWGSWPAAVELFRQDDAVNSLYGVDVPEDWPDPTAYWIWGTAVDLMADPPQAVGKCYFRRAVNFVSTGDFAFLISCDDAYRLFVDGVLVGENGEAHMFRRYARYDLFLESGTHDIAIECENIARPVSSTNSAGLLVAVYLTTDGGELDNLAIHSDDDWKVLAYPSTAPGMTPGEILEALMWEAWDRGGLWLWSYDFSDTLDAGGDAWTAEIDIGFAIGAENYLDVLRKLAEATIDIDVDWPNSTFRVFNKGGLDTGAAVTLSVGDDLLDLHHAGEQAEATVLLVRKADGTLIEVNSGVPAETAIEPRIEAYFEAGSAPSTDAAERMSEAIFDRFAAPAVEVTFEVHPDGPAPWADFWPGKTITVPDRELDPVSVEVQAVQIVDVPPSEDGAEEGSYRVLGQAR